MIALAFLYFLGLIPAFIALIIPGIWLSIAWTVSFPALLSEGIGPVAALGRSFRLVQGRWWPTFGAVLVMNLIVGVISAIITGIITATLVGSWTSEATAAVFTTVANTLSALVTLPLSAAVLTVIYFDLRVRKEGFDLQLLARGVGQDESAYATSAQAVGESSGLGGCGSAPARAAGSLRPRHRPRRPSRAAASRRRRPAAPPSESGLQSGDPLAGPRSARAPRRRRRTRELRLRAVVAALVAAALLGSLRARGAGPQPVRTPPRPGPTRARSCRSAASAAAACRGRSPACCAGSAIAWSR